MASYHYKSQHGLSSRHEAPSSIPQRNPSSRLPTKSATPISSASHASGPSTASSKLTKRKPEAHNVSRVYGNAAGATSSSQRVVAPSKSSGSGAMRRENATGSGRTQPTHSPHPTTIRPPRFDAASSRTPSLMSASTASASSIHDSPRSTILRKKVSSIGRPTLRATRTEPFLAQEKGPASFKAQDSYSDAVFGIAMPSVSTMDPIDEERRSMLAPSLRGHDLPHQLNTDDLPPPTPAYALSASPSTRYSESPGRFSHTSSPTSMSSHSPGVVFPSKLGPRQRQSSPTRSRPPVTRRKTDDTGSTNDLHGLPSLHESTASSSSSSTVLAPASDRRQLKVNTERPLAQRSPLQREVSERLMSPLEHSSQITVETRISVQSTREAPIYPPELAHLADTKSPQRPASHKPLRPSREGTPDLLGLQAGPSPVVQSNLTRLPARHRRQASSGSGMSPLSADASRRPSLSISPNPSVGSTFSPVSGHVSTTRGTTPDQQHETGPSVPPSPNKSTSRFGFFSKRTKSEGAPAAPRKEKKLVRKGPMAGTGHEGYGRYGIGRGRSTSATSIASSYGRSTSQDSVASNSATRPAASRKGSLGNKSEPEMDGFLRDRLNPKVLRGTGSAASSMGTNSEGDRSATSLDSVKHRPVLGARNDSTVSVSQSGQSSVENNGPSLLPSAMADPVRGASPFRVGGLSGKIRRPASSDSNLSVNLIPSSAQNGSGQFYDQHAAAVSDSGDLAYGRPENQLKEKKPEIKPPRKWNFFQRAQSAPKPEPRPQAPSLQQMPLAISGPLPSRSVAHYEIDDSLDKVNLDGLERLMEEAERLGYESSGSRPPSFHCANFQPRRHGNSILLPSPPVFSRPFAEPTRPTSPKVLLRNAGLSDLDHSDPARAALTVSSQSLASAVPSAVPVPEAEPESDEMPLASPPPRPSRLQQVGRIPQVISTRDRMRNISQNSFSRPFIPALPSPGFQREQIPQDAPVEFSPARQDISGVENASPPLAQDAMPRPLFVDSFTTPEERINGAPEFFAFSPRKFSELSYTSSSGASFPPSTAVIPAPADPPQEDEVWNEYDDLIDEVLSSPESHGTKRKDRTIKRRSRASAALPSQQRVPPADAGDRTTVFEEDISPRSSVQIRNSTAASVHLRRSRLLAAFQSLAAPSSAETTSDFHSNESRRGHGLVDSQTARLSLPSICLSLNSVDQESEETVTPQSNAEQFVKSEVHFHDSRMIEAAETSKEGLVSMADLRYNALMVSQWLSFGRVLFSPAHFELEKSVGDRILVIDGLGQDWSYYCAHTYSSAQIYYINPMSSNFSVQTSSSASNYHQIHHPDLLAPFPFPKGFFATVVFRFPSAAPEFTYRAAISECKRVLRPGGYLEVSVLDLDLVNMGNRARRAVRDLKMRMQSTDSEVCLMNASDAFQRLIGRRGFENLNRCIVGVPTAGKMTRSVDLTNEGGASKASTGMPNQANFGDLVALSGKEGFSDDNMSKMVARVGRWWYSRCYESMVLQPNGDSSQDIWSDETLLNECEKRQTSFRLLICYAQKPTVTRRRTVSV